MSEPAGPRRPICCPPHASASLILIYSLPTTISLVQCSWSPRSLHCAVPLEDRDLVPEEQTACKGHCVPGVCAGPPGLSPRPALHWLLSTPAALSWAPCWGPRKEWLPWHWLGSLGALWCSPWWHIPGSRDCPHCTWGLGAAGSVPLGSLLGCSDRRGTLGLPGQVIPSGASLRPGAAMGAGSWSRLAPRRLTASGFPY